MNREQEIRIIAYHIWEEEGCGCPGRDVEDWLKAEIIWQERNQPVRTVAEINPSASNRQINSAVKSQPATLLRAATGKKDKTSKKNP
jgi:hypothetical protein